MKGEQLSNADTLEPERDEPVDAEVVEDFEDFVEDFDDYDYEADEEAAKQAQWLADQKAAAQAAPSLPDSPTPLQWAQFRSDLIKWEIDRNLESLQTTVEQAGQLKHRLTELAAQRDQFIKAVDILTVIEKGEATND